jgi:hypothetical protein
VAGTLQYAVTQLNPAEPVDGGGTLVIVWLRGNGEGTSALHFTYSRLADRDGSTIANATADCTLSTTAPSSPTLSIERLDDTTARLNWTAADGVAGYDLYRDTDPYFTASDPPSYTTSSVSYDDVGVLGDTSTNHYYAVRSACEHDFHSANSNRVGEFAIELPPAWTLTSLPLVPASTSLDDVIGDQLSGTCDSANADRALFWNAEGQQYEMAWYCDCDGWGPQWDDHWLTGFAQTSLDVEPDVGFWIENRSGVTETIVVVGDVSAIHRTVEVTSGWQMLGTTYPVSVTLDDAAIPATGTCDSATADRALFWNAESQQYEMAWYCDCDGWGEPWDDHWLTGFDQTTIELVPGRGIWLHNRHDPFTWTYPNQDPGSD